MRNSAAIEYRKHREATHKRCFNVVQVYTEKKILVKKNILIPFVIHRNQQHTSQNFSIKIPMLAWQQNNPFKPVYGHY